MEIGKYYTVRDKNIKTKSDEWLMVGLVTNDWGYTSYARGTATLVHNGVPEEFFVNKNWKYEDPHTRSYKESTSDEIKWLDACIKVNKYIPKEEAMKTIAGVISDYQCLAFPIDKAYIKLRVVKNIPAELNKNCSKLPFIPKGSITWVDLNHIIRKDLICPENNKYQANIPSEYFEIIEKVSVNQPVKEGKSEKELLLKKAKCYFYNNSRSEEGITGSCNVRTPKGDWAEIVESPKTPIIWGIGGPKLEPKFTDTTYNYFAYNYSKDHRYNHNKYNISYNPCKGGFVNEIPDESFEIKTDNSKLQVNQKSFAVTLKNTAGEVKINVKTKQSIKI